MYDARVNACIKYDANMHAYMDTVAEKERREVRERETGGERKRHSKRGCPSRRKPWREEIDLKDGNAIVFIFAIDLKDGNVTAIDLKDGNVVDIVRLTFLPASLSCWSFLCSLDKRE